MPRPVLADLFCHEAPNVAASLGIEWAGQISPEDEARINAEFDRLYDPRLDTSSTG